MEEFEIVKLFAEKEEKITDVITEEIPFTIYVNDKELVTLLASPVDLKDLAAGFLLTAGLIKNYDEIKSVILDNQRWTIYLKLTKNVDSQVISQRMYTSGCGRGTLFYNVADILHKNKQRENTCINRTKIFALMKEFQGQSKEFEQTGGVHSAALADSESILIVREDIGRHNAVDKILGCALKDNIDLKDKMILSSGRVSSEILLKIQKTPIPIIISRSAPTNQAIKHAKYANVTLIGFVRGQRMNVYSGDERIV